MALSYFGYMGYLRTIITYDRPSEAEVDKAFLESQGFPVCLLNANTSRNELGAPFYIQLQVNDEDFAAAKQALKEVNPQRFGSPTRVAEIDRAVKRWVLFFLVGAIPSGVIAYFLIPGPMWGHKMRARGGMVFPDFHIGAAVVVAILTGVATAAILAKKKQAV